MLATLRHFRLFALIALAASPGVGGAAVQALHQCPVASAAAAGSAHHGSEAAAHHGGAPAAPADSHEQCHCIGDCCAAALAVTPASGAAVTIATESSANTQFTGRERVPVVSPLRLLPPATAPPAPMLALLV